MAKKRTTLVILVIICLLILIYISYIVFHQICGPAHWARHIRQGTRYDEVVKHLGEPQWSEKHLGKTAIFDLGNGVSIIVSFYTYSSDDSELRVFSYDFIATSAIYDFMAKSETLE